jgi:PAS domain S-box-containing protein
LLSEQFQIYGYTAFGTAGVLAVLGGILRNRPTVALPWYGLVASLALLVAGDLLLNNYAALFHEEAPFPNIADALFITGNLSVALMLALLARRRAAPGDIGSYVDALIVVTTASVLSWIFLMVPYATDPSLTLLQKLVAIAYPSFDLAMLVVAARLIFAGGARTPAFWLVIGALTAGMVTDTIFSVLVLEYGEIGRGHIVELGWLLWWVLWGAGALHPSMRTLTETGPERPLHITGRRLAILASIALIVPEAGFVEGWRSGITDQIVIAAGSATLFGLVLWRMHELIVAVEAARSRLSRALERERVLRSASASLVAAPSREAICDAALMAISELTGLAIPIRILLGTPEAMTVVASTGGLQPAQTELPLAGSALEAHCSVLRSRRSLFLPHAAAPSIWEALGIGEWPEIGLFPLSTGADQCGLIIVAGLDAHREGVTAGLEVLASQVALALERTALAEDLLRRRSEERFHTLVRNASDIILIVDAKGIIQYASPSVERVLGYEPACLTGQDSLRLVHPEDQEEVRAFQANLAESPGLTRAIEFRMHHQRGD